MVSVLNKYYKLNARKERCRSVWESYGVITEVLFTLPRSLSTKMQCLNRFFYKFGVSRVFP